MSASEKLKALDGRRHEMANVHAEIVAVVEAAEATPYYACKVCGFSPTNRANWCDLGCGRDYNTMLRVRAPALAALDEALS